MKRSSGVVATMERVGVKTSAPPEAQLLDPPFAAVPISPEDIRTVVVRQAGALATPSPLGGSPLAGSRRATLTGTRRLPEVPGYDLLNELGRGGMGVVYRASCLRLKRIVAVKTLVGGCQAHTEDLWRFRAEAEAVARLRHPNIVQVYEVGDVNGQPFFAMEYVEGGSLADQRGTAQPPMAAARLIAQIARAMSHAHGQGIVHRDLKPDNILLTPDKQPKITDFGIAKYLDGDANRTKTGAVLGTPAYMAPEQAMGRVHEIGPATDVYALGAILYELLTARPPIEGDNSLQTLQQIILAAPAAPRRLRHDLPRDLESICLKCLEREPERRYRGANDLADDLERFLQREPVHARPIGQLGRMTRWCRRNRVAAALIFVVAAVFLLGMPAMSYLAWWNRALFVQSEADRHDAEQARDAVKQSDRTSRGRVARLHAATGVRLLGDGDLHRALVWTTDALVRTTKLRLEEERAPGWEEHILRTRAAALVEQCPRLTHNLSLPTWAADICLSADGRHVTAQRVGREELGRWRLDDGAEEPWLFQADPAATIKYTADARWALALSADQKLSLWDVAANRLVRELESPPSPVPLKLLFGAVSASGTHVFASVEAERDESRGWIWHSNSGKLVNREPTILRCRDPFQSNLRQSGFTKDGQRLLVADCPKSIVVIDVATGTERYRLSPRNLETSALSGNGKRMAAAFGNSVRIWDIDARLEQPTMSFITHAAPISRMLFDARGERLLTASEDGTARLWNAATGAPLSDPLRHGGGVRHASFSPDERWLLTVSNDGAARIWDLHGSLPLTPQLRHGAAVISAAWAADGSRIATLAVDGSLRIWDLATSGTGRLLLHDGPVSHVQFSPDGRRLLTGTENGVGRVWDIAAGKAVGAPLRHADPITYMNWTGPVLVTVAGKAARAWDADTGRPFTRSLGRDLANGLGVEVAAASPTPGRLAIQFVDKANIFDWHAGRDLTQVNQPEHGWRHISHTLYSPDGKFLATSSGYAVVLWDANTCKEVHRLEISKTHLMFRITFTPDGRYLETAHSAGVRIWDTATGRLTADWAPGVSGLRQARLSPDGAFGLTVNGEDTCQVWDVAANRPLGPQFNLGGMYVLAEFAGGADYVATVRADGEARLWDWHTGEPLTAPMRHGARAAAAALSPDGQILAVAGRDGAVRLWPLPRADASPDDELNSRASLLSSHQVADQIELGLIGLTSDEMHALQKRFPTGAGVALPDALSWHTRQADEARRAGQWHAAAFHLDRLLTLEPKRTDWLRQRAEAFGKAGQQREALADWLRVCTQTDAVPDDRAARGRHYAAGRQWHDALKEFRAATKRDGSHASWWLWRALAAIHADQPDEADGSYREALRRAHNDHLGTVRKPLRGFSHLDSQDLHEIRRAVGTLTPTLDDAIKEAKAPAAFLRRLRGLAAAAVDDWKVAEEHFAEAVKLNETDAEARRGMALVAIRNDGWQFALEHVNRACELSPEDGSLRLLRSYALLEVRQPFEALAELEQAVNRREEDVEARVLRGALLRAFGRFAESIADYSFAIDSPQGRRNPSYYFERGNTYALLGHWQPAYADFKQASALSPPLERFEYPLAVASLKTGAVADYQAVVRRLLPMVQDKVVSDIGQVHLTNSIVWVAVLGPPVPELARCIPAMEAAVKADSKNPDIRNTLGALLMRTGRHEEALVHLQTALAEHGGANAWDLLFLAQAQHGLGKASDARASLAKAREWIDQAPGRVPMSWLARAELDLLAAEVEAKLEKY